MDARLRGFTSTCRDIYHGIERGQEISKQIPPLRVSQIGQELARDDCGMMMTKYRYDRSCALHSTLMAIVMVLFLHSIVMKGMAHDVEVLCRRCGATITRLSHVLDATDAPPDSGTSAPVDDDEFDETGKRKLARFKNKVGQTFDVALFKSAVVNSVSASRSVQDSFYPGYAWRIAECPVCGTFLGWSYDRPAHCHAAGDHDSAQTVKGNEGQPLTDPEQILDSLFSTACLTKNLMYWTVEWCHKRSVKQFHISGATMKRDPEYSLGAYSSSKRSSVVDSKLTMLIPGTIGVRKIVEHAFVGGQHCDETNAARSTVVSVVCCVNYHQSLGPLNAPFIASLREPTTCSYEMIVCVPELCQVPGFAPPVTAKLGTAAAAQAHAPATDDQVCASGMPPKKAPLWFFGFDWSTLITERSPEMFWTRTLHPVIGTGQLVM